MASDESPGRGPHRDRTVTTTQRGRTDPAARDAADPSGRRGGRADRSSGDVASARSGGGRDRPVGPDDGPDSPTDLPGSGWRAALRRTVREFSDDSLTDWAAALTYYGVLSIFPGLL